MIVFEGGRTALLVNGQIVFGVGDAVAIENCRARPLGEAIDVPLTGIAPPVMFALLTLPEGEFRAALPLKEYTKIAIASARATAMPPQSMPARLITNVAARAQQRFGGCCGRK